MVGWIEKMKNNRKMEMDGWMDKKIDGWLDGWIKNMKKIDGWLDG